MGKVARPGVTLRQCAMDNSSGLPPLAAPLVRLAAGGGLLRWRPRRRTVGELRFDKLTERRIGKSTEAQWAPHGHSCGRAAHLPRTGVRVQ